MPIISNQMWAIRNLEMVKEAIEGAVSIVICGHANPDGDSIGAVLSLGLGLKSMGKSVYMLCTDSVPAKYRLLPGVNHLASTAPRQIDLAIAVDCGSKEIIGPAYSVFQRAAVTIEIDHHRSRTPFADLTLVDPEACSAGELVYELLLELGVFITDEIAQNVLTSLIVETNSFRLPGIRPRTFELCAELLGTGVNFNRLAETVYWVTSRETAILSGICMSRCHFLQDGEIAWASLSRKDYQRARASDTDADPVAEKIRSIQGVKVAILFREKQDHQWRVSLRSKEGINVSTLAEHFGGGGHLSAAGFTIPSKKRYLRSILNAAVSLLKSQQSTLPGQKSEKPSVPAVQFYENVCSKEHSKHCWEEAVYTEQLGQKIAF